MDERESHIKQDIEETRTAMTEQIEMIEGRVHETMEGTKSTIDNVMENVKRVQGTVEQTKATIDNVIETIKSAMDETIERVKYTSDLVEQVYQNPWIMLGSAILTGYVLGSVNRDTAFGQHQAHAQDMSNSNHEKATSRQAVS